MLNRRNLFTAAPAAVVVAAMPLVAVAATADSDAQLLFWEREAARLYDAINSEIMSEDESEAMIHLAAEYEARIAEAPCDSNTAAIVKLRTVVREGLCGGAQYRINYTDMIDSMVSFMESRA